MPQFVLNKCRGLYTFPNALGELPVGALSDTQNVVINRDGVVEPRRGFAIYGNAMGVGSANTAKQLFAYKGRILRHYSNILQYDSNGTGTFSSFTGNYSEVSSGLRIKGKEINGNFYYTTAAGIKKISAASAAALSSATIGNAGGVKALDGEATLNEQTGFFTQDSTVAYRIVWGIRDNNNNLILGSPSERIVINNPITDLLIKDFNALLAALDTVSNLGGINDGNYVSSLKVTLGSSASTLRTNVIALATKIDNDTVITEDTIDTVSGLVSSNVASLVFDTDISTFLEVGDQVVISGLSGVGNTADFNGTRTITAISTTSIANDTISFALTHGDFVSTADTGGAVKRLKYTLIASPAALSTTPTTTQLEDLQDYYDDIVNDLQLELAGIVTDASVFNTLNSTQSSTANVIFTIPSTITTAYFYQIYRTPLNTSTGSTSLTNLDPGDELQLVYEDNPTSAQITAGSITVHDIVPESFLAANLYTNPVSGEGIGQANEVPPLAKDIALYNGYAFYANTQTKYRKNISLLSVTNLVDATSTITVTDGSTSNVYTFVTPVAEITTVETVADVTDSLNGKYFTINATDDTTQYYVWYKTSGGSVSDPAPAGKTGIRVDITTNDTADSIATATKNAINEVNDFSASVLTDTVTITNATKGIATNAANAAGGSSPGFTITVTTAGKGEDATNKKILISDLSTPAQQVDETARSLVRVINKNASELIYAYYLSGPDDVPGLILLESRTLGGNAFYLNVNSTTTGGQFSPVLPTSGTSVISNNETNGNRIYYSKFQQPEAVPLLNYIDVGAKDKSISRIIALRDSLFIFKENEGVFRLSGETAPFSVSLFDSSTNIKATDSADVLNNQIYLFSDQGIVTISDTGVSIISRPIEDQLIKLINPSFTNFSTATFGLGYESDRSYYLFTVAETSDTVATQCFRFNTFTNTWTKLILSKTCGIINQTNDKMYLGAGDTNFIEQERKNFNRTDYADRETTITIDAGSVSGTLITLGNVTDLNVGDIVVQTQYLTINQFNRLLKKLDRDTGVTDVDYNSTLAASAGNNLRLKLDDLTAKLDADAGLTDTDYASTISAYTSSFSDTQTAFNAIITKLNADTGANFSNYVSSTGTIEQEINITSISTTANTITTAYAYPFIAGTALVYKHIESYIIWAPQSLGDTSISKHIRESTIMFESSTYTDATVSYSTDLNPDFEETDFDGSGTGIFGNGIFGNGNFGGSGTAAPFRTLVPRDKQRCRFIQAKIVHATAREKYSIFGISYTFEPTGSRAYR